MLQMSSVKSVCVFIVLGFLCLAANAQSAVYFFDDKPAFDRASERVRTIDFEDVAPAKGFGKYAPDVGLDAYGIRFRTHGGARFGSGTIYVPSLHYMSGNPGLKMIEGAHLAWGAPNQPGNAHLELSFPAGVRAVGSDVWAMQPIVSPIEIAVTTRDGRTHTSIITTRKRPDSTFVGFVSKAEIASVRFTLPKGQSTLLLDNLAYGRMAETADLAALAAKPDATAMRVDSGASARPAPISKDSEMDSREPFINKKPLIASPVPSGSASSSGGPIKLAGDRSVPGATSTSAAGGSIAYVRAGKEIRMVNPDGSNDRRFWTHTDAHAGLGINELAWSPDGTELAFSSGHESVTSYYHADIFSMRSNGTGVRRITNGPDRSDYAKYGKGTVTVTVRNEQPIYQMAKASTGVFFVYVMGAEMPQPLTLPPGSSRTLTFKNVADFGDHAQAIVAVYGSDRWIIPGTDVKAGRIVKAPDFGISGNGLELFGAFRPAWTGDGSRISYRNGVCIVSSIASKGAVGHTYDPMFKGENPPRPCAYDYGPTPATADHLLYSVMTDEEIVIYRLKGKDAQHPGEKMTTISKENLQWLNDIRWLPDGSGFLYSASELAYGHANIFKYDLATRQTVQITKLEEAFVKGFSISPDGKWIAFERTKAFVDNDADLWIVRMDGRALGLLTKNANHPAWGR